LMLGLFNLIPALPMDGGRILRGLLARKMEPQVATQIAAKVARVIAIALGAWAIFSANFSLGLIAVFVYQLANREERQANLRAESVRWARGFDSKTGLDLNGHVIDVSPDYARR
jgi:Zn-dependent protease